MAALLTNNGECLRSTQSDRHVSACFHTSSGTNIGSLLCGSLETRRAGIALPYLTSCTLLCFLGLRRFVNPDSPPLCVHQLFIGQWTTITHWKALQDQHCAC